MNKLQKHVSVEQHKLMKNKTVTTTTVIKSSKKQFKAKEISMIGEALLKKAKKNAKLMIKVLSNQGYFTMKHYDDDMSVVMTEQDYLNGREGIEAYTLYKASFYILQ